MGPGGERAAADRSTTDPPTAAETGDAASGSARDSTGGESKQSSSTIAEESDGAVADNAKKTKNYHVSDYPGFEGVVM